VLVVEGFVGSCLKKEKWLTNVTLAVLIPLVFNVWLVSSVLTIPDTKLE
jgi:hypothetical protein